MPDNYKTLSPKIASANAKQMNDIGGRIQAALEDGYLTDIEHAALTREHHRRWVVVNAAERRAAELRGDIQIHDGRW